MIGKIYSGGVLGVKGVMVSVEADVSDGLPGMVMVGSLSSSVKEAQDRVRTAMKNAGFRLLAKKVTVNLSPANIRKNGTGYDVAIALAILGGYGVLDSEQWWDTLFVGELGLDGEIKPVHGVMSIVDEAVRRGFKRCFLPSANVREGTAIGGIRVAGVSHLRELTEYLDGSREVRYTRRRDEVWEKSENYEVDFREVNGQSLLRRATEVAVAGMHNILYVGAAGTGKTMIARRIPTIMPSMTTEEAIEVSKIYSICGLLPEQETIIRRRPFRGPHHSITAQALIGGGQVPKPGEISLSSHGVLFLDELAEFPSHVLDLLRQPLEEKRVTVARMGGSYEFPADCMLAAAMNPCMCGMYPGDRCICTENQIHKYLGRVSRPFLDRIDICVESAPVVYEELRGKKEGESSARIRERIEKAREIQMSRLRPGGKYFNSEMKRTELEEFCRLSREDEAYMAQIYKRLELSPRGCERLLRVARTIADLEGETQISKKHLNEAVSYRSLKEKFWGKRGKR